MQDKQSHLDNQENEDLRYADRKFYMIDEIFELPFSILSHAQKLILNIIIQCMNDQGVTEVSNHFLARKLGLRDPDKISPHMTALKEKKFIKRTFLEDDNKMIIKRYVRLAKNGFQLLLSSTPQTGGTPPPILGSDSTYGTSVNEMKFKFKTPPKPRKKKTPPPYSDKWGRDV